MFARIDSAAFFESDAAMRLMTGTLDRLLLVRCASPSGDDVIAALRQVPALCANEQRSAPLRLLVIDNVAANFWYDPQPPLQISHRIHAS